MPKKVGDSRQFAYSGISKRTNREQLDRQFRNLPKGKGEFARAIKELRLSKKNESKVSTQTAPLNEYEYRMTCLLYTSPSPRDKRQSRMPSSA